MDFILSELNFNSLPKAIVLRYQSKSNIAEHSKQRQEVPTYMDSVKLALWDCGEEVDFAIKLQKLKTVRNYRKVVCGRSNIN